MNCASAKGKIIDRRSVGSSLTRLVALTLRGCHRGRFRGSPATGEVTSSAGL